jgi:hypothetical protein
MSRRVPATHSGECQWCGRSQLLPAGVLAKHGQQERRIADWQPRDLTERAAA